MADNQSTNSNIAAKLKRLHPDAIFPTVGSEKAACYDLYALEDVEFEPGEIKVVRTGWAIETDEGLRTNIYVRSSTPFKKKFILANSVGIIDEDYRGELGILLMNVKVAPFRYAGGYTVGQFVANKISKGDKIGQFEFLLSYRAAEFEIKEVDELNETKRGEGGFGSTGG